MQVGRYGDLVDFGRLSAPFFRPHLMDVEVQMPFVLRNGCGATAFWSLTGSKADMRFNKLQTQDEMVNALRSAGCVVEPVTMCRVADGHPKEMRNVIGRNHVVLFSSLMFKGEGSWLILHKNKLLHNFVSEKANLLETVNRPMLNAYVVWRPEWGVKAVSWFEQCSKVCSHMGASRYIWETNGYRRLSFMTGSFGKGRKPCRIEVNPDVSKIMVGIYKYEKNMCNVPLTQTDRYVHASTLWFKWHEFERKPRMVAQKIREKIVAVRAVGV